MLVPLAPNERWSLDFVSDQLTDGRRFRILTALEAAGVEFIRENGGGAGVRLEKQCGSEPSGSTT